MIKKLTDKDLIVYLSATGHEIVGIKKEENCNRSVVYFNDTEKLNESILSYVNKTEKVNVADFLAAERRIKTLFCMQKS